MAGPKVVGRDRRGREIVERPLSFGPHGLFGVSTEVPEGSIGPTAIFLSVANEHHVGPARTWVDLARRWAGEGIPSVRLDLSGLGDSPLRHQHQGEFIPVAPEAFDDVIDAARAISPLDPSNVILVGLCASAYQALDSAFDLYPRGVLAINPILSFVPTEYGVGLPIDPRRRVALPKNAVVQAFHEDGPLAPLRRKLPDIGWWVRLAVAGQRRPGSWIARLGRKGVFTMIVAGEREGRPIRLGSTEIYSPQVGPRRDLRIQLQSGSATRPVDRGTTPRGDRSPDPPRTREVFAAYRTTSDAAAMTTERHAGNVDLITDHLQQLAPTDIQWLSSAVRVGIDVTLVSEVRESMNRFGERYLNRIYTPHELVCCEDSHGIPSPERLAARFAAKEATLKVLRISTFQPPWTEMEVRRHPSGWCDMALSGTAELMARREGMMQPLSLSLTHEGDLAMAVVITFSQSRGTPGIPDQPSRSAPRNQESGSINHIGEVGALIGSTGAQPTHTALRASEPTPDSLNQARNRSTHD